MGKPKRNMHCIPIRQCWRLAGVLILAGMLMAGVAAAQTGWTVGGNGGIWKSTDGGVNWSGTFPTFALLTCVHFNHPDTGWVAGGQVILKTVDAGATWVDRYNGGGFMNSVFFYDSNRGWAAGNTGEIARSTNGGETWTSVFPTSAIHNDVFFISPTTGWVAGGQVILKSTDGGVTWTDKYTGGGVMNSVFFINSSVGWAVGNTGEIAKSTDAGEHWTSIFPTSGTLNSVFFINSNTGWVAGGQVLLKTVNGGSTWVDKYNGGADLQSVHFVDAMRGWAAGSNGTILTSTDGGESWIEQVHPTTATLESVIFPKIAVRVQTNPAGRIFTVDGISSSASTTFDWVPGSSHTIATTSPQSGSTGAQYVWTGWSDGGTISHSVAPLTQTTFTATFKTQYQLTMSAGSGGSVSPASGFRDAGSIVSISATPDAGFQFTGWTGSGSESYSGPNNPASVTMNAPISEAAAFTPVSIPVTIGTSPVGRSFTVDGTTYTSAQTLNWVAGTSHTISTSSPQAGGAGTQYVWTGWSDGGALSHTVAPTSAITYTASFKTQYQLSMNAGAGGTVSPSSGFRDAGSTVSISAAPDAGFTFSGWSGTGPGSYTGSSNPASVTMSGPITEAASFVSTISVTVGTNPSDRSFTVDGVNYTSTQTFSWSVGSSHAIATTSPQSGAPGTQYAWTSWSDGGAMSHIVAPTTNTTLTANFKTQYLLGMETGPGGSVTPATGYYDAGSTVTITAFPLGGWVFAAWSGQGAGSYSGPSNPASVTMLGPISEMGGFMPVVSVDVNTNPADRAFTVDGVTYMSAQSFTWPVGSSHVIGVPSPQAGDSNTQYVWTDWSDGGAISHTVSATSPVSYTASFKTQYMLTMLTGPGGSAEPTTGFQDAGSTVAISANPDVGYAFSAWNGTGIGSYSGQDNPATIIMSEPIVEAASFVSAPAELHLRFQGSPIGELGENPIVATGLSYEATGFGSSVYLGPGNELRYPTGGNIDGRQGTLRFWIKPRWSGNDGQDHYVMRVGGAGGILVGKDAANFWRIILNRFGSQEGPELGTGVFINDWVRDWWHHVAFTWDPASVNVYIDGLLRASAVPAIPPPAITGADLQLGADGGGAYLDALIDEFEVSDRVWTFQEILTGVEEGVPEARGFTFRLGNPVPNPSHAVVNLVIDLERAGSLRVNVYDVHGHLIHTLVDGFIPKGPRSVRWDGKSRGMDVPSGIYWIVGTHDGVKVTRKVVLVR